VSVPFLRPFRLIRVVAILLSASKRAGALAIGKVLLYVAILATIVMCVGAVVVYHYEHAMPNASIRTVGGAFWWAFTTMSTVGVGNTSPTTAMGRVVAVFLIFIGLGVVGCITAAVAAAFVNAVRGRPMHEQIAETRTSQRELLEKIDVLSEMVTRLHEEITVVRHHLGETSRNGMDATGTTSVAPAADGSGIS
jgi:voltage-gated potassium channel